MGETKTVAGAFAKIEAHEDLCAERYAGINRTLNELRLVVWSVLFGLIGWMAVQLWNGQDRRIEKLEAAPAPSISTTVVK